MLAKYEKVGYVCFCYAGLAQLVEQRIRNAWVGRSNLLTGTNKKSALKGAVFFIGYRKGRRMPDGRRNRVALRLVSQCREDPQAKAQRHLLTGTNKKSALKGAVFLLVIGRGEERPTGLYIFPNRYCFFRIGVAVVNYHLRERNFNTFLNKALVYHIAQIARRRPTGVNVFYIKT